MVETALSNSSEEPTIDLARAMMSDGGGFDRCTGGPPCRQEARKDCFVAAMLAASSITR